MRVGVSEMNHLSNAILFSFLIFSVIFITGCSMSPEKAVKKFEQAVEENDPEALHELINKEEDLHWEIKEAEDVIAYFISNEAEFDKQLQLLEDQKAALKGNDTLQNEQGMFYFDEEKLLQVRAYEISLDQASVVPFEQLTITMNDADKITIADAAEGDMTIGTFGPGIYEMTADADYSYVILDDKAEISVFDMQNFKLVTEMNLQGEALEISSQIPDAELLINEQATGILFGSDNLDDDNIIVQPMVEGLTLQGKVTYEWGEVVSDQQEFFASYSDDDASNQLIDLTPYQFDTEDKEDIAEIVSDLFHKYFIGLSNRSTKDFKDVQASDELVTILSDDIGLAKTIADGELNLAIFPAGYEQILGGIYVGTLKDTILDFQHVSNVVDEDTGEDLMTLSIQLYSDFHFTLGDDTFDDRYMNPEVYFKKIDDKWVIVNVNIDYNEGTDVPIQGDNLVTVQTK